MPATLRRTLYTRQQNQAESSSSNSTNIALAVGLGVVAVIALLLTLYLLQRLRNRNNEIPSGAESAAHLNRDQYGSTRRLNMQNTERSNPVTDPQYTIASGYPNALKGRSASVATTITETTPEVVIASYPRLSVVPETGYYHPGRGSMMSVAPPAGSRRSIAYPALSQDDAPQTGRARTNIISMGGINEAPAYPVPGSAFQVPNTGIRGDTPNLDPFDSPESDEMYDGEYSASTIINGYDYGEVDGDIARARSTRSRRRDTDATMVSVNRNSMASTFAPASAVPQPRSIPAVPPLPPVSAVSRMSFSYPRSAPSTPAAPPSMPMPVPMPAPPPGPGPVPIQAGLPAPPRPKNKQQARNSRQVAGTSFISEVVRSARTPTEPPPGGMLAQQVRNRGQLRITGKRKERPASVAVPMPPKRLDVIISVSPHPGGGFVIDD